MLACTGGIATRGVFVVAGIGPMLAPAKRCL